MKKQVSFFIYAFLFLIIILSPFWLWLIKPSKELNVLILDKSAPSQASSVHKGLVWILNNGKYQWDNQKSNNINKYDVIYLTEQYFETNDIDQFKQTLLSTKGKTFMAEFDTFASTGTDEVREKISNILNIDWTGWIGRYFIDLTSAEVPDWIKNQYEAQNQKWNFSGEGFVFISKNNFVVVIDEKDMLDSGALFHLTEKGKSFFNRNINGTYQYWFDINSARDKNEVLASYELPISKKKKAELMGYGIPSNFPAVLFHQNSKYNSFYFAGDYADEAEVPSIYQTKGLELWREHFGTKDSFYWTAYVPMMQSLLSKGLNHTIKQEKVELVENKGIQTNSRTSNQYIQIQKHGKWEDFLIKGVNMGIAKPGYFPGETAITKEEYFRWFKTISNMNANAIRVYTLHPPEFYEAFYEYNQIAKKPLYLFHGSWVNEENLIEAQNSFTEQITADAKLEIKNMIDIIHGKANIAEKPGHASGVYNYDISKYVLGIIVGIEWDPYMVISTNEKNQDIHDFKGGYFNTEDASPFEVWLATLMDFAASYEANNYQWQHSLSFTNWVTTDLLDHPAEPLEKEDLVGVDPNHIQAKDQFQAGLFASYHIYPYYPDFLNYEQKYLDYVDKNGRKNNYAGYLNELAGEHKMPVLVAEFGVPASRGLTHKNPINMNQGFLTEDEQGEINQKLFQSIVSEGYAGGLVFTWQDEWFKRTWNTMDLDNPDRRPYWNNMQTSEQHFGLLSFEPDKKETVIFIDGRKMDWEQNDSKLLYQAKSKKEIIDEIKIYADSGYLYYLLCFHKPVDFNYQEAYLLLDTITDQGQHTINLSDGESIETNYGVDFLVKLAGPEQSKIMVDSYYDPYYFQYAHQLNMIKQEPYANQKNNGVFHPIRLALNKELTIPSTNTIIPFEGYETGTLKFGTSNPIDKEFGSLTDISMSDDKKVLEGRIPWQLLNVKDPSLKEVMSDLWKNGLNGSKKIDGIRIAMVMSEKGKVNQTIPQTTDKLLMEDDVFLYTWNEWDHPVYHERLKKSYEIIKKTFGSVK